MTHRFRLAALAICLAGCDGTADDKPSFDLTGRWRFDWYSDGQENVDTAILRDDDGTVSMQRCGWRDEPDAVWRRDGDSFTNADWGDEATIGEGGDYLESTTDGDEAWVACRDADDTTFAAGSLTLPAPAGVVTDGLCADRTFLEEEVEIEAPIDDTFAVLGFENLYPDELIGSLAVNEDFTSPQLSLRAEALGLGDSAVYASSGTIDLSENTTSRLAGTFTATFPGAGELSGAFDVSFLPKCTD